MISEQPSHLANTPPATDFFSTLDPATEPGSRLLLLHHATPGGEYPDWPAPSSAGGQPRGGPTCPNGGGNRTAPQSVTHNRRQITGNCARRAHDGSASSSGPF